MSISNVYLEARDELTDKWLTISPEHTLRVGLRWMILKSKKRGVTKGVATEEEDYHTCQK
jgi:hypothetical protein